MTRGALRRGRLMPADGRPIRYFETVALTDSEGVDAWRWAAFGHGNGAGRRDGVAVGFDDGNIEVVRTGR